LCCGRAIRTDLACSSVGLETIEQDENHPPDERAAYLPLDLIGGAAPGVTVASGVNLLLGVPMLELAENTASDHLDSTLAPEWRAGQ
jgi:hypothetical protein